MENPEGNIKPQQTGGLKVMTVFVFVLVLHVLVLGGFAAYSLLRPATTDQDVTLDKNHATAKIVSDGSLAGDLPATADTAAATDKTAAPSTTEAANMSASAASAPATPASTPATTAAPVADTSEPITVPNAPVADTASSSIQHGPVIDPPVNLAPVAPSLSAAQTVSPVPAADNAPVGEGTPYLVKKGDSLAKIARQHHVTLAKLKAANSLSSDNLKIGQKMVIPNRTQKALATATPAGVDSIAVPTTTSTPVVTTADADLTAPAAPATSAVKATKKKALAHTAGTSASGHHLYTVVKGDTLTKIARKFKTTPNAIMTANNLTDAGRISIGKKLRIPSGESRSAAAASAPAETPAEEPETRSAPKGQLANFVQ